MADDGGIISDALFEAASERAKQIAALVAKRHFWHYEGVVQRIAETCESPIEVMLAVEMLDLMCPINPIDTRFFESRGLTSKAAIAEFESWERNSNALVEYGPRTRVGIFPQAYLGTFRVDFLVLALECRGPDQFVNAGLVIECDGHEFHERTKAQAAKDRARDRAFTAMSTTFLRFTGSEIYKDARACMLEVENILWRKLHNRDCPLRQYDDDVTES